VKNQYQIFFVLLFFFAQHVTLAQYGDNGSVEATTQLFRDSSPLSISLRYSDKELREETDDSTYLKTKLAFLDDDGIWDSLTVRLRARGNWRKKNCFLSPVKMEIKKKQRKKNVFKGNKELKLVLPCRNNENGQDYIIREYIAYKLYEEITPYHFKTRMLTIDYEEVRKRKDKSYALTGFLIEDISEVAKRNDVEKVKNKVHPLNQDDIASIQNDFFQFMIGNTDYSTTYQHNEKMIFIEGKNAIPVPYDFDMSGMVDPSYAVVSQIPGEEVNITDVKQRLFRGFDRDQALFEQVRQQFLAEKDTFLSIVDSYEDDFLNERNFKQTRDYVLTFFEILEDDDAFQQMILDKTRKL